MPVYVPTNNPQSTKYAAASREAQLKDYREHGPPPRNYYTARTSGGAGMIYSDHSVSDAITTMAKGGTKTHPCSDAGMKSDPRPTYAAEFTFARDSSTGFFDPPLQYVPPQVKWNYHANGWESALAAEITKKGIKVSADQLTASYDLLVSDPKFKNEQSHILYHPADRGTAIFMGEPAAALVARWGAPNKGFSLVIVCPLIRANGVGWERIYDTKNRPPIYARWSVGEQAVCEPVVLMCLPKIETSTGRESYRKDVDWFSMDPTPNSPFEKDWNIMWKTYNVDKDVPKLAKEFDFPVMDWLFFAWTLAVLHRRIALGDKISDDNLGSWIQQYGAHLGKCGKPHNPKAHKFAFDSEKSYKGRKITYHILTGWILNPKFGNGMVQTFAKRMDDAYQALINYNLDRTDANWITAREKSKFASTPPW